MKLASFFRLAVLGAVLSGALMAGTAAPAFAQNTAIQFDGTNDYVTFGADTVKLGLSTFTLELWFYRTGTGVTVSTGTGGVTAVPLFTKGRGEGDGSKVDMNYFLGIQGSNNVIVTDYEEGTGQTSPGLNHPAVGVTPVRLNTWYHVAATFDGTTWRIYLNGILESTTIIGAARLPQDQSLQHAGLGTAMTSAGLAAGFFQGIIDEPRIWDHALTQQEIIDNMKLELASGTGINGRWGLNEGSGTIAYNSVAASPNGTLTNGPVWTNGSPFDISNSLKLGASNAYVTFRNPSALGLGTFTIETWFRRDGAGTAASTGTGGVTALPLVTHGAAQDEGGNLDMNWFLGIRSSDNVICADFEEATSGATPGLNHPITGVTPIVTGQWYHAAASYDGSTWKLYLNGVLENELFVGQPPESNTLQHAALGTTLRSDSVAAGYFNGALDEARVWNYARSAAEIESEINSRIAGAMTGLVARWGLDEGAGSIVRSTAGASLPGSIKGTGSSWDAPAPFNIDLTPVPPAAPSALAATAISYAQINLSWVDNSTNETGFEIERSTYGPGGPFSPLGTAAMGATSYTNDYVAGGFEYCYRVRATGNAGPSDWTSVACATTPVENPYALDFGASNGYVTFGDPAALDLAQFTIETWFRRDGTGTTANTGSGGFYAVPLVTKGVGEADGDTRDMNFFLGIRGTDNVLAADFEATPGGQNYPVVGVTPVTTGEWHHAAVTYDGTTWRLYLDGVLETETTVNATPQWQSIQHAGLGVALNSTGGASGHFDGALDETRIWNYPRTEAEIQAAINEQLAAPQTGLAARWALNEGTGTRVHGSAGTAVTGTIVNTEWSWVGPAPFDIEINYSPDDPLLVSPADGAVDVPRNPTLEVAVSDPEADSLTVTFYGRPVSETQAGAPFSIALIPDTQYYTEETNGGTIAIFQAQTRWIARTIDSLNTAYAQHIGDVTDNGDTYHVEWERSWSAMQTLEDPDLTGRPEGLPYGVTVGNHDQTPNGDPVGTTSGYNEYFGSSHFAGRSYYGGHYGSNNDAYFNVFSASGLDFIVISMEYDTAPDAPVLAWADSLLKAYPTRKGLIMAHNMIGTGIPGSWSGQGSAIYEALKDNPNLFLMFGGHNPGEGRRSDTYLDNTVHTLLADYQSRANGGSGWLRVYRFYPAENVVRARTYSPTLNQFEADADSSSQFTLNVDLTPMAEWQQIATITGIPSGSTAQAIWPGLDALSGYEWYVTVSDGANTTTGPVWSFTTISPPIAVAVQSFEGAVVDDAAVLKWSTSVEESVDGFNILRSENEREGFAPVNAEIISSKGPFGGAYQFKDAAIELGRTYYYELQEVSERGTRIIYGPYALVARAPFELAQNAPNPFNPSTTIKFTVAAESDVKLVVYDALGRQVRTLVDERLRANFYLVQWDGLNDAGRSVASGIYFYRMQAGRYVQSKKMLLLR